MDQDPVYKSRNSGLCIATGTGKRRYHSTCCHLVYLHRLYQLDLQHKQAHPPRRGELAQDHLRDYQVSPQLEGDLVITHISYIVTV